MDKGLLQQTAKNGKARIFSYTKYLEILRKDTWFPANKKASNSNKLLA